MIYLEDAVSTFTYSILHVYYEIKSTSKSSSSQLIQRPFSRKKLLGPSDKSVIEAQSFVPRKVIGPRISVLVVETTIARN